MTYQIRKIKNLFICFPYQPIQFSLPRLLGFSMKHLKSEDFISSKNVLLSYHLSLIKVVAFMKMILQDEISYVFFKEVFVFENFFQLKKKFNHFLLDFLFSSFLKNTSQFLNCTKMICEGFWNEYLQGSVGNKQGCKLLIWYTIYFLRLLVEHNRKLFFKKYQPSSYSLDF